MGRYIPVGELIATEAIDDFLQNAANAGRRFLCKAVFLYPGAIQGQDLTPEWVTAWWQDFCSDQPNTAPSPKLPPFSGGQCEGVVYKVTYRYFARNIGNCSVVSNSLYSINVPGPIHGIIYRDYASSGNAVSSCSGTPHTVRNKEAVLLANTNEYPLTLGFYVGTNEYEYGYTRIEKIETLDGSPDTCGNPGPSYPPYTTIPPSGQIGSWSYSYNNNEYVTDFTIKLSPGIVNDVDLSFPITVNVGGVNMDFDLGGVNIRGNSNVTNNKNNKTVINNDGEGDIVPPSGEGSNNNTDVENPEDFDADPQPPSEGEEKGLIEKLAFVKLDLIQIPTNANSFSGGGNAPDTYRAGWFEFKSEEYCYPRQFIDFKQSIFVAPEGADGYAYSLNKGYLGQVTIIKKKEKA